MIGLERRENRNTIEKVVANPAYTARVVGMLRERIDAFGFRVCTELAIAVHSNLMIEAFPGTVRNGPPYVHVVVRQAPLHPFRVVSVHIVVGPVLAD